MKTNIITNTIDPENTTDLELLAHTKDIVVASLYKSSCDDISKLIKDVFNTVKDLKNIKPALPRINWKDSIKPDYITCLEDGVQLKMLTRHLKAHYNLTPAEYRKKWGLPSDYPMTCPNYSIRRRELALNMKLGTKKD